MEKAGSRFARTLRFLLQVLRARADQQGPRTLATRLNFNGYYLPEP